MAQQPDNRSFFERRLGLPPIGDIKGNVDSINTLLQTLDKEKLRQAITLANLIIKIQSSGKPGEIGQVSSLMEFVSKIPTEKITSICTLVEDLIKFSESIRKLITMLPPDMLDSLNVGDLIKEVKGGMG